jgi:hypothetical protein
VKSVERINLRTGNRQTLATFTLVGERVVADWRDADYQFGVEASGIMGEGGHAVRPQDGRPFYDALEGEYYNSSRIAVVGDDPS